MNKYYHRGEGECVVPGQDAPPKPSYGDRDSDSISIDNWNKYIKALPVVAYCDPKNKVGWMQGYEERYEVRIEGAWLEISKRDYSKELDYKTRIVLIKK